MQSVLLGGTKLCVSRLCFGSLTLGPLQAGLSPSEGGQVLLYALQNGVNFIDTAQYYRNYEHIRYALDRHPGEIIVASKTYAHTRELAVEAVEEARKALNRDVIEIFLLHEQESEHTLRGHREALEQLYEYKARGILRAVGLSAHKVAGVRAARRAGLDVVHPLLNMEGLGLTDGSRADMEAAVADARAAGMGVYTMKALGGGNLLRRAAEALRYALPHGHALALGMKSKAEVDANLRFFREGRFNGADEAALAAQGRRLCFDGSCDGCGECEKACRSGAITVRDGQAVWDASRCILCGYCGGRCPQFNIRVV